jgi:DNA-binding protein YbaB
MLEDLITAAVNEALTKAEDMMQQKMGGITGGMNLGGMF